MKKQVAVGLSGGVDSAVAAALLLEDGYAVVGQTLLLRDQAEQEVADAERVAGALGIAHQVLDLRKEFQESVVAYFIAAYQNGRTPNPCVVCNQRIKFGLLLEYALQQGMDYVATGHYARIGRREDRFILQRSASPKDQSYFLHTLSQWQLAHILFPLDGMEKADTRALAQEYGIPVAQKRDSQEICFVPQDDYAGFIQRHTGTDSPPGDFVDSAGKVLGRHQGIMHYTVGQRKGLGAFGRPMYVIQINSHDQTVVLGAEEKIYAHALLAQHWHWIAGAAPTLPLKAMAQIRHRAKPQLAQVSEGPGGTLQVAFQEPVRSAAPGQFVVLYDGDTVLGGGEICQAIPASI